MAKQERQTHELAQVFKVLGDPTRLRIWRELQNGEKNVTELCQKLKAPQPTVSHHLGIMRMSGLVSNRRSGKEIFYSLNDLTKDGTARAIRGLINTTNCVQLGPFLFALAKE